MDKSSKYKLSNIFKLLPVLRLDVYVALYLIGAQMPSVTLTQMVEDKYCINNLGVEPSKCLQLESLGTEFEDIENQVLSFSTTFLSIYRVLATVPGIFLSVFFGYWVDTYPNQLKYLLVVPAIGGCISNLCMFINIFYFKANVYHLLWGSIPYGFSGGAFVVLSGSYTYVTRTTATKYRVVRFAILEFFINGIYPVASGIGGKVLETVPWFSDQPRNYLFVYVLSFASFFIGIIWLLALLNDRFTSPDDQNVDNTMTIEETKSETTKPTGTIAIIKDIFNPSTVCNMIKVCCRKRPHNRRMILWNLILSTTLLTIGLLDETAIGLQFAQKVYGWDSAYYSYVYACLSLVCTFINTIFPAFLIHKLHIADTTLCIIGSASFIIAMSISGGYLEPAAYFIAKLFTIFYKLLSISIRSIISRLIDGHEAGEIFSLLACLESIAPTIGAVMYSLLFDATIDTFPSATHLVCALMMFYPYLVSLWFSIIRNKWDPVAMKMIMYQ